jgi:adenine-specific DNA-methyltransferase
VRSVYGEQELAKLVWDRNRKNDAKYFSVGHEYMLVLARDRQHLQDASIRFREPKEGIVEAREHYTQLAKTLGDNWDEIRVQWMKWFDDIPVSDPKRRLMRYTKVGPRGPYRDDGNISWPGGGGPRYEVIHPITKKACKIPSRGWMYPQSERFWEEVETGRVVFGSDETTTPRIASYLLESEGQVMPTVFYSYAQTVAQEFDAMFGDRVFDNPKNWRDLVRMLRYLASETDAWILDYFAGSGTTAQAVMSLNREDGGRRKYILVEMGHHFDDVLRPRVRKAAYSTAWRNGKPVERDSASHCFKYVQLESYDDALNNLELRQTGQQGSLLEQDDDLREQYVLSYMLDVESRGSQSLLNVESFRNPDQYKLKVERNGETQLVNVDLVETFNWLLGLTVKHIDVIRGVRVVEGTNPNNERVIVLWRNLDETDNDALDKWFAKQDYNTKEQVYDLFYVNGDNNLENLRRGDQTWKVRMIEEEFGRLMFDVEDA